MSDKHCNQCKDCVHSGLCYRESNRKMYTGNLKLSPCEHFKNKADFVEVEKVAEILAEQCGDYPCNLNDNAEWISIDCDCKCSMKCWEKIVRHYGDRKENE